MPIQEQVLEPVFFKLSARRKRCERIEHKVSICIFIRFINMIYRKCRRVIQCRFQRFGSFCNMNQFCGGSNTKLICITETHGTKLPKKWCSSRLVVPLGRKIEPLRRKTEPRSRVIKRKTVQYNLSRSKFSLVCPESIEPFYMSEKLNRANVNSVVIHDSFISTHHDNPCQYGRRLTARKLRRSNSNCQYKDRAPSRVYIKTIMKAMKNRKYRKKVKQFLRHSTPKSSVLNHVATDYKEYHLKFINRQRIYSDSFAVLKHLCKTTKKTCFKSFPAINISNSSTILGNLTFKTDQFCVIVKKLMMSGDIEQNPGPLNSITNTASLPVYNILESRLEQLGLRPLDVGGEGDCFFRVISHQLYGDCNHHLDVRYMRENPERFIESNLESSWNEYLANMSLVGTWCDHLVIQAVADILNLRIHIVESDENFASFTTVEAVGLAHQPTVVHIGHLGEYHYVSTSQFNSRVPNVERILYITMKHNKQKQKREYMKEYMRKKRL